MRWEYKTIKCKKRSFFSGGIDIEAVDEMLNAMGRDGWELVSTCPDFFCATPSGVVLMFKRQK
jgi:hypothetical protein